MPQTVSFDECFQTVPKLDPPTDLDSFWKEGISVLKKVPIKATYKTVLKGSFIWESLNDVSFQSIDNHVLHGKLAIPRKRGNRPVVVYFHDYLAIPEEIQKGYSDLGVAQLHITLRGHGDEMIHAPIDPTTGKAPIGWTPNYFAHGLDQKEEFYMRKLYLDVIRTIEFLRLTDGIDGDQIILHGKSLGSALSVFGAAYSDRIKGLILETPSFCYIDKDQISLKGNPWVRELTPFLEKRATKKIDYKKELAYFDALNFAKKIKIPALVSCGMEDVISHPKSTFALFNHMNCDKRMQLYPTEGNEAGKDKQPQANLEFVKEIFAL
ncbi:acetylxylan esterase [Leptospira sp. 201903074]|uniref:acetylxylan esterase n=1 Tax=Leptospira abararensis TaxID=2810036 RepID=UPI00196659C6|nr:acetylxylan esterase [Leptospira abararensis]MBM9547287.1 acetylxylan esterase [Leptospira abararensis]